MPMLVLLSSIKHMMRSVKESFGEKICESTVWTATRLCSCSDVYVLACNIKPSPFVKHLLNRFVASSEKGLQHALDRFAATCNKLESELGPKDRDFMSLSKS